MKKSALKNRIKSFYGKHKMAISVVFLSLQLAIGLTIYFLFGRLSPNDRISVPEKDSVAFLVNENPKFSVNFGTVEEPEKQIVRFEAETSRKNPFESEDGNIFSKINGLFQKKERYGIEMSLVGVNLEKTDLEKYGEEVVKVADVIGTDNVKTSTELIDVGREIGKYNDDGPVSKQTVLNKEVADGVDLEYQILTGLGLKEEIIIRDLEAYKESCKDSGCKLPLNEFVFDLNVDEGVEIQEGWFTIDGKSTSTYYFVDSKGRYIAHFLPNFAIDNVGYKTSDVDLKVEKGEGDNYRAKVTVDTDWLFSSERVFPVRIDPSIVHDDAEDFSGGIFNRTESVTGPKIQKVRDTEAFDCTGGTVTTSGEYKIHTFTSNGTLTCNTSGNVEVLVVGGGGGGNSYYARNYGGGGGGAGGAVYNASFAISAGNIGVTVGNGGAVGTNGNNSVFSTITAYGGGAGGRNSNGAAGGCGGGAASTNHTGGTASQGYRGGNSTSYMGNAGGGGMGSAGVDLYAIGHGTNGGTGVTYSISGSSVCYAGGGGGGAQRNLYGEIGYGQCGGGNGGGGSSSVNPTAGTANTGGGGGGGAGYNASYGIGAAGGSGVVIVRYIPGEEKIITSGEYTSSSIDMGSSISEATLSWTPSGVNTGDGETPYSTTGLVAQWNFNETSGTTAVSGGTCGTSCNGTLTNFASTGSQDAAPGTGWTANNKRWGAGALMFDGSDDYVSVVDSAGIQFGTGNFTFETWVNPTVVNPGTSAQGTIISKNYTGFELSIYQGYLLAYLGGTSNSLTGTTLLKTSTWYHIVLVRNGSTVSTYINGILDASTNNSASVSNIGTNLYLGQRPGGDSTKVLNGTIDSTRIYSRALSANEILSNYQAANIEFQYRVSTDNSTWSNWTSYGTSASDLAWESFDNPYLYGTTDTGLVAYWPMDEASGTSVADVKGSNTGTATGTKIIDGKYSKARSFNGSSDYISVASTFGLGTTSYSIEAWVNIPSTSDHGCFIKIGDSTSGVCVGVGSGTTETNGNKLILLFENVRWIDTGVTIGIGWHHISMIVNGSGNPLAYIDGKLVYSDVGSTPLTPVGSITGIGNYGGGGSNRAFNGTIDEVRIFNIALSATSIMSDYTEGIVDKSSTISQSGSSLNIEGTGSTKLASGPYGIDSNTVGLWHLDERGGSGAYLKDSTTNSNSGTPTGTTYTNVGKIGGARSFNGSSDYIGVSSPTNIPIGNSPYTIEAWIYPTATGAYGIVGWGTYGTTNWCNALRLYSSTQIVNYWWGNDLIVTVGTITTSTWHYVVATFDGTTRKIYFDGVLYGSDTPTGHAVPSANNFRIGSTNNAEFFPGKLDEVRISNIARTANEIAESYKLGKDSYINQTLNTTDLSTKNTMAINIASDRPGTYLSTMWGESAFANYQPDINTVGLWHMNEIAGAGAYIKDVSGYGNNGTPIGTTYTNAGKIGGARSFNGSSDYISVASTFGLGTTSYSIEAWVNIPSTSDHGCFIKIGDSTSGVCVGVGSGTTETNGNKLILLFENVRWIDTGVTIGIGWHHISMIVNGSGNPLAYIDGKLVYSDVGSTPLTPVGSITGIGNYGGGGSNRAFNGTIDEVRISNASRTADQIRQAYEVGLRTHDVNIDFGASLVSGNLIVGSGDTSFSIDATVYGLDDLGSGIYKDEKIIVKENYDGTEYIAQGTISTITETTGAVTVSSWDSGSTFPSGGYTVNADVFKWQKEYIPIKNRTVSSHVDAVNLLTFRITNGDQGRNVWIDDLRSSSGYLSAYTGEELTFPSSGRYFQYKAIFSTWDNAVTPYISQVQLDYFSGPTNEQLMRHGKWFDSSGTRKGFWWVGTH
ncbi:MAG TPA: LamG domain-containing protein [Candidatus Dojkabacteria bacterium]|nr:LamG domain-containing protein [Candidatus Dojkabacteria bacterium]